MEGGSQLVTISSDSDPEFRLRPPGAATGKPKKKRKPKAKTCPHCEGTLAGSRGGGGRCTCRSTMVNVSCDLCGQACPDQNSLDRHLAINHGNAIFSSLQQTSHACPFCGLTFTTSLALANHRAARHGDNSVSVRSQAVPLDTGVAGGQQIAGAAQQTSGAVGQVIAGTQTPSLDTEATGVQASTSVLFKCNLCKVICPTVDDLERHVLFLHTTAACDDTFLRNIMSNDSCPFCPAQVTELKPHLLSNHADASRTCTNCSSVFPVSLLAGHVNNCKNSTNQPLINSEKAESSGSTKSVRRGAGKLACPICASRLPETNLGPHLVNSHAGVSRTCPNCFQVLPVSVLVAHVQSCKDSPNQTMQARQPACSLCKEIMWGKSYNEYLSHMNDHRKISKCAKNSKYYCTVCQAIFPTVTGLRGHVVIHQPFPLDIPTNAAQAAAGTSVREEHQDQGLIQMFKCSTCSQTFKSVEEGTQHAKQHLISYCPYCDMKFKTAAIEIHKHFCLHKPGGFSQEELAIDPERRACLLCRETLADGGELRTLNHMVGHFAHLPGNRTICTMCFQGFENCSELAKHLYEKHSSRSLKGEGKSNDAYKKTKSKASKPKESNLRDNPPPIPDEARSSSTDSVISLSSASPQPQPKRQPKPTTDQPRPSATNQYNAVPPDVHTSNPPSLSSLVVSPTTRLGSTAFATSSARSAHSNVNAVPSSSGYQLPRSVEAGQAIQFSVQQVRPPAIPAQPSLLRQPVRVSQSSSASASQLRQSAQPVGSSSQAAHVRPYMSRAGQPSAPPVQPSHRIRQPVRGPQSNWASAPHFRQSAQLAPTTPQTAQLSQAGPSPSLQLFGPSAQVTQTSAASIRSFRPSVQAAQQSSNQLRPHAPTAQPARLAQTIIPNADHQVVQPAVPAHSICDQLLDQVASPIVQRQQSTTGLVAANSSAGPSFSSQSSHPVQLPYSVPQQSVSTPVAVSVQNMRPAPPNYFDTCLSSQLAPPGASPSQPPLQSSQPRHVSIPQATQPPRTMKQETIELSSDEDSDEFVTCLYCPFTSNDTHVLRSHFFESHRGRDYIPFDKHLSRYERNKNQKNGEAATQPRGGTASVPVYHQTLPNAQFVTHGSGVPAQTHAATGAGVDVRPRGINSGDSLSADPSIAVEQSLGQAPHVNQKDASPNLNAHAIPNRPIQSVASSITAITGPSFLPNSRNVIQPGASTSAEISTAGPSFTTPYARQGPRTDPAVEESENCDSEELIQCLFCPFTSIQSISIRSHYFSQHSHDRPESAEEYANLDRYLVMQDQRIEKIKKQKRELELVKTKMEEQQRKFNERLEEQNRIVQQKLDQFDRQMLSTLQPIVSQQKVAESHVVEEAVEAPVQETARATIPSYRSQKTFAVARTSNSSSRLSAPSRSSVASDKTKLRCRICSATFDTDKAFIKHLQNVHPDDLESQKNKQQKSDTESASEPMAGDMDCEPPGHNVTPTSRDSEKRVGASACTSGVSATATAGQVESLYKKWKLKQCFVRLVDCQKSPSGSSTIDAVQVAETTSICSECPICSKIALNTNDHIISKHSQELTGTQFLVQCPACKLSFRKFLHMYKHMLSWHGDSGDARQALETARESPECLEILRLAAAYERTERNERRPENETIKLREELDKSEPEPSNEDALPSLLKIPKIDNLPFAVVGTCPVCESKFASAAQANAHIVAEHAEKILGVCTEISCPALGCTSRLRGPRNLHLHLGCVHKNDKQVAIQARALWGKLLDDLRVGKKGRDSKTSPQQSTKHGRVVKDSEYSGSEDDTYEESFVDDESPGEADEEDAEEEEEDAEQTEEESDDNESTDDEFTECPVCKEVLPTAIKAKDHIVAKHSKTITGKQYLMRCPGCEFSAVTYMATYTHILEEHDADEEALAELQQERDSNEYQKIVTLAYQFGKKRRKTKIRPKSGQHEPSPLTHEQKSESPEPEKECAVGTNIEGTSEQFSHKNGNKKEKTNTTRMSSDLARPVMPVSHTDTLNVAGMPVVLAQSALNKKRKKKSQNSDETVIQTVKKKSACPETAEEYVVKSAVKVEESSSYSCPVCNSGFDDETVMKVHIVQAHCQALTGARYIFKCPQCGVEKNLYSDLCQHVRSSHPGTEELLLSFFISEKIFLDIVNLARNKSASSKVSDEREGGRIVLEVKSEPIDPFMGGTEGEPSRSVTESACLQMGQVPSAIVLSEEPRNTLSNTSSVASVSQESLTQPTKCPICEETRSSFKAAADHILRVHSLALTGQQFMFHCQVPGCHYSSSIHDEFYMHLVKYHSENHDPDHKLALTRQRQTCLRIVRLAFQSQLKEHEGESAVLKYSSLPEKLRDDGPSGAPREQASGSSAVFSCPICCRTFKHLYRKDDHVLSEHSAELLGKPFTVTCSVCRAGSGSIPDAYRHVRTAHPGNHEAWSSVPRASETDQYRRLSDMIQNWQDRGYRGCPVCKKIVKNQNLLQQHILDEHSMELTGQQFHYQCPACEFRSAKCSAAEEHVKVGHPNRGTIKCIAQNQRNEIILGDQLKEVVRVAYAIVGMADNESSGCSSDDQIRRQRCPMCSAWYQGPASTKVHILETHSKALTGQQLTVSCPRCKYWNTTYTAVYQHALFAHPEDDTILDELEQVRNSEVFMRIVDLAYESSNSDDRDASRPENTGADRPVVKSSPTFDAEANEAAGANDTAEDVSPKESTGDMDVTDGTTTHQRLSVVIGVRKKCPVCQACFSKITDMKDHVVRYHSLELTGSQFTVQCPVPKYNSSVTCDRSFCSPAQLYVHVRLKHGRTGNEAALKEMPFIRSSFHYQETLRLALAGGCSKHASMAGSEVVVDDANHSTEVSDAYGLANSRDPGEDEMSGYTRDSDQDGDRNSLHSLNVAAAISRECPVCLKQYQKPNQTKDHIVRDHSLELTGAQFTVQCPVPKIGSSVACNQSFRSYEQIYRHLRSCHGGAGNPAALNAIRMSPHYQEVLRLALKSGHGEESTAEESDAVDDASDTTEDTVSSAYVEDYPVESEDDTDIPAADRSATFDRECPICRKRYTNKRTLENHIIAHHSVDLVGSQFTTPCSICGKCFRDISAVCQHIRAIHAAHRSASAALEAAAAVRSDPEYMEILKLANESEPDRGHHVSLLSISAEKTSLEAIVRRAGVKLKPCSVVLTDCTVTNEETRPPVSTTNPKLTLKQSNSALRLGKLSASVEKRRQKILEHRQSLDSQHLKHLAQKKRDHEAISRIKKLKVKLRMRKLQNSRPPRKMKAKRKSNPGTSYVQLQPCISPELISRLKAEAQPTMKITSTGIEYTCPLCDVVQIFTESSKYVDHVAANHPDKVKKMVEPERPEPAEPTLHTEQNLGGIADSSDDDLADAAGCSEDENPEPQIAKTESPETEPSTKATSIPKPFGAETLKEEIVVLELVHELEEEEENSQEQDRKVVIHAPAAAHGPATVWNCDPERNASPRLPLLPPQPTAGPISQQLADPVPFSSSLPSPELAAGSTSSHSTKPTLCTAENVIVTTNDDSLVAARETPLISTADVLKQPLVFGSTNLEQASSINDKCTETISQDTQAIVEPAFDVAESKLFIVGDVTRASDVDDDDIVTSSDEGVDDDDDEDYELEEEEHSDDDNGRSVRRADARKMGRKCPVCGIVLARTSRAVDLKVHIVSRHSLELTGIQFRIQCPVPAHDPSVVCCKSFQSYKQAKRHIRKDHDANAAALVEVSAVPKTPQFLEILRLANSHNTDTPLALEQKADIEVGIKQGRTMCTTTASQKVQKLLERGFRTSSKCPVCGLEFARSTKVREMKLHIESHHSTSSRPNAMGLALDPHAQSTSEQEPGMNVEIRGFEGAHAAGPGTFEAGKAAKRKRIGLDCPVCMERFTRLKLNEDHIVAEHSLKLSGTQFIVRCPHCEEAFSNLFQLYKHIAKPRVLAGHGDRTAAREALSAVRASPEYRQTLRLAAAHKRTAINETVDTSRVKISSVDGAGIEETLNMVTDELIDDTDDFGMDESNTVTKTIENDAAVRFHHDSPAPERISSTEQRPALASTAEVEASIDDGSFRVEIASDVDDDVGDAFDDDDVMDRSDDEDAEEVTDMANAADTTRAKLRVGASDREGEAADLQPDVDEIDQSEESSAVSGTDHEDEPSTSVSLSTRTVPRKKVTKHSTAGGLDDVQDYVVMTSSDEGSDDDDDDDENYVMEEIEEEDEEEYEDELDRDEVADITDTKSVPRRTRAILPDKGYDIGRKCPVCRREFSSPRWTQDHIVGDHSLKLTGKQFKVRCPECKERFFKYVLLYKHMRRKHPARGDASKTMIAARDSPECQNILRLAAAYEPMESNVVANTDFVDVPIGRKCPVCEKAFWAPNTTTDHIIGEHSLQLTGTQFTVKCPKCPMIFRRCLQMYKHIICQHDNKVLALKELRAVRDSFECREILRLAVEGHAAASRIRAVTSVPIPSEDVVCVGDNPVELDSGVDHQQVERNVQKPIDNKANGHSTGTMKRSKASCPKCHRKFRKSLRAHIIRRHGGKLLSCDCCHLKFFFKEELSRHMADQHYKCRFCLENFSKLWKMVRHVITNHVDKRKSQTPCLFCEQRLDLNEIYGVFGHVSRHCLTDRERSSVKGTLVCGICRQGLYSPSPFEGHVSLHGPIPWLENVQAVASAEQEDGVSVDEQTAGVELEKIIEDAVKTHGIDSVAKADNDSCTEHLEKQLDTHTLPSITVSKDPNHISFLPIDMSETFSFTAPILKLTRRPGIQFQGSLLEGVGLYVLIERQSPRSVSHHIMPLPVADRNTFCLAEGTPGVQVTKALVEAVRAVIKDSDVAYLVKSRVYHVKSDVLMQIQPLLLFKKPLPVTVGSSAKMFFNMVECTWIDLAESAELFCDELVNSMSLSLDLQPVAPKPVHRALMNFTHQAVLGEAKSQNQLEGVYAALPLDEKSLCKKTIRGTVHSLPCRTTFHNVKVEVSFSLDKFQLLRKERKIPTPANEQIFVTVQREKTMELYTVPSTLVNKETGHIPRKELREYLQKLGTSDEDKVFICIGTMLVVHKADESVANCWVGSAIYPGTGRWANLRKVPDKYPKVESSETPLDEELPPQGVVILAAEDIHMQATAVSRSREVSGTTVIEMETSATVADMEKVKSRNVTRTLDNRSEIFTETDEPCTESTLLKRFEPPMTSGIKEPSARSIGSQVVEECLNDIIADIVAREVEMPKDVNVSDDAVVDLGIERKQLVDCSTAVLHAESTTEILESRDTYDSADVSKAETTDSVRLVVAECLNQIIENIVEQSGHEDEIPKMPPANVRTEDDSCISHVVAECLEQIISNIVSEEDDVPNPKASDDSSLCLKQVGKCSGGKDTESTPNSHVKAAEIGAEEPVALASVDYEIEFEVLPMGAFSETSSPSTTSTDELLREIGNLIAVERTTEETSTLKVEEKLPVVRPQYTLKPEDVASNLQELIDLPCDSVSAKSVKRSCYTIYPEENGLSSPAYMQVMLLPVAYLEMSVRETSEDRSLCSWCSKGEKTSQAVLESRCFCGQDLSKGKLVKHSKVAHGIAPFKGTWQCRRCQQSGFTSEKALRVHQQFQHEKNQKKKALAMVKTTMERDNAESFIETIGDHAIDSYVTMKLTVTSCDDYIMSKTNLQTSCPAKAELETHVPGPVALPDLYARLVEPGESTCGICGDVPEPFHNLKYHGGVVPSGSDANVLPEERSQERKCKSCFSVVKNDEDLKNHEEDLGHMDEDEAHPLDLVIKNGELITLKCRHCPRVFTDRMTFGNHKLVHEKTVGGKYPVNGCWKCSTCNRRFYNTKAFKAHKQLHLITKCENCGLEFESLVAREMHLRQCLPKTLPRRFGLCGFCGAKECQLKHEKSTKCRECGKKFKHCYQLMKHMSEVHRERKELVCKRCDSWFGSRYLLMEHLKSSCLKVKQRKFKCHKCKVTFETHLKLMIHKARSHGKKETEKVDENTVLKCRLCTHKTTSETQKRLHDKMHAKQVHQCATCSAKFFCQDGLENHIRSHHTHLLFECHVCKVRLRSRFALRSHVVQFHHMRYRCATCCLSFESEQAMLDHQNRHNEASCSTCGRLASICKGKCEASQSKEVQSLVLGTRSKRTDLFECPVCLKTFPNEFPHLLEAHTLDHIRSGLLLKCENCDFSCVDSLDMYRHAHEEHVMVTCTECLATFSHSRALELHKQYCGLNIRQRLLMSTIKWRLYCQSCNQAFLTNLHLGTHNAVSHKTESLSEFACSKCEFQSNKGSEFTEHYRLNHPIVFFECMKCELVFCDADELRTHQVTSHPPEVEKKTKKKSVKKKVSKVVSDVSNEAPEVEQSLPKVGSSSRKRKAITQSKTPSKRSKTPARRAKNTDCEESDEDDWCPSENESDDDVTPSQPTTGPSRKSRRESRKRVKIVDETMEEGEEAEDEPSVEEAPVARSRKRKAASRKDATVVKNPQLKPVAKGKRSHQSSATASKDSETTEPVVAEEMQFEPAVDDPRQPARTSRRRSRKTPVSEDPTPSATVKAKVTVQDRPEPEQRDVGGASEDPGNVHMLTDDPTILDTIEEIHSALDVLDDPMAPIRTTRKRSRKCAETAHTLDVREKSSKDAVTKDEKAKVEAVESQLNPDPVDKIQSFEASDHIPQTRTSRGRSKKVVSAADVTDSAKIPKEATIARAVGAKEDANTFGVLADDPVTLAKVEETQPLLNDVDDAEAPTPTRCSRLRSSKGDSAKKPDMTMKTKEPVVSEDAQVSPTETIQVALNTTDGAAASGPTRTRASSRSGKTTVEETTPHVPETVTDNVWNSEDESEAVKDRGNLMTDPAETQTDNSDESVTRTSRRRSNRR